ncbi:hypothetical protein ACFWIY_25980 [Streptomyces sioyaensis]|uniref:hypothetical protein n=1 Tax=Streptomyces sioyaensis TaxID=67364 RepID=UPI00365313A9
MCDAEFVGLTVDPHGELDGLLDFLAFCATEVAGDGAGLASGVEEEAGFLWEWQQVG